MKGCQVAKAWERNYEEAKKYFEQHGDLSIPGSYKTKDGIKLNAWIQRQRQIKLKNRLSNEQIELLDQIGMKWELDDSWLFAISCG